MLKKFLIFNLIFIYLNVCAAVETKVKAEQQFLEINPENLKYLHEILLKEGLATNALHNVVFDYLKEYKCIKTSRIGTLNSHIEFVLPNDNVIVRNGYKVQIWDLNGNLITKSENLADGMICMCVLRDNQIALGHSDNIIQIYDFNFNYLKTIRTHTHDVKSLCSLNDNKLASVSFFGTIKIWDINSGDCLQTIDLYKTKDIFRLRKLTQNGIFLSIADNGSVYMRNVNSGKFEDALNFDLSNFLTFLSDNKLAYQDENKIVILDINSKEVVRILEGHTYPIEFVCSLSNKILVSYSDDETIRIWDIDSGECLQILSSGKLIFLNAISNNKFISGKRIYTGQIEVEVWAPRLDMIEQ